MSARVIFDTDLSVAALYDSVTGRAFGPTFNGDNLHTAGEQADCFLAWCEPDPRILDPHTLDARQVQWAATVDGAERCPLCSPPPSVARTECCGTTYNPDLPLAEQELRDYPDAGVMHLLAIGDTAAPDQACRHALHRQDRCAVLMRYMGGRLCGEPSVSGDYCAEHAHDAHEDARERALLDRHNEETGATL